MLQTTKICIIAAIGKNRELGKDNKLLWHIPEDLKRFKQITSGHPIIMGRKTFESIGRPLPNRLNIVITRDKTFNCHSELVSESDDRSRNKFGMTKCLVVHSLDQAIDISSKYYVVSSMYKREKDIHNTNYKLHATKHEVFIIGGGKIFEQAMPIADRLYLTIVDASFDADVFFPDFSMFTKVISEQKGESNGYKYIFLDLEKITLR